MTFSLTCPVLRTGQYSTPICCVLLRMKERGKMLSTCGVNFRSDMTKQRQFGKCSYRSIHTPLDAAEAAVIAIDRFDRVSRSAISRKSHDPYRVRRFVISFNGATSFSVAFFGDPMFCSNQAHISPGTSDNLRTGGVDYGRKEECSNFHHDSGDIMLRKY